MNKSVKPYEENLKFIQIKSYYKTHLDKNIDMNLLLLMLLTTEQLIFMHGLHNRNFLC